MSDQGVDWDAGCADRRARPINVALSVARRECPHESGHMNRFNQRRVKWLAGWYYTDSVLRTGGKKE